MGRWVTKNENDVERSASRNGKQERLMTRNENEVERVAARSENEMEVGKRRAGIGEDQRGPADHNGDVGWSGCHYGLCWHERQGLE